MLCSRPPAWAVAVGDIRAGTRSVHGRVVVWAWRQGLWLTTTAVDAADVDWHRLLPEDFAEEVFLPPSSSEPPSDERELELVDERGARTRGFFGRDSRWHRSDGSLLQGRVVGWRVPQTLDSGTGVSRAPANGTTP